MTTLQTTHTLPENYVQSGELNLAKNPGLTIWLNIIGLAPLVGMGLLCFAVLGRFRADIFNQVTSFSAGLVEMVFVIAGLLLETIVMLVLHEAVHGVFFWFFTKNRPKFGFKGAYAYAAAPGWYLPRNAYLVVGLAPLVVISLIGLALLLVAPVSWLFWIILLVAFNAGGAIGDMAVAVWILTKPGNVLYMDFGDGVLSFQPAAVPDIP
jgi:hypothetical protein